MTLTMRVSAAIALLIATVFFYATLQSPLSTKSVQRGYRGDGQDEIYHDARLAGLSAANALPEAIDPVDPAGQKASSVYKNVQVLGDVDIAEFGRLMASFAAWVAPKNGPSAGCAYCHGNEGNFASDALYTKRVARRMLQMTQHINVSWKTHVAKTGVTCYTCHRGQPVPSYIWYENPGPASASGVLGGHTGKNSPSEAAGLASLPDDPFTPFLDKKAEIRVISTSALPTGDRRSIKQADWTYGLMMHMSQSLGVNCDYCHNTRAFYDWNQSSPARVTAWYGIRMVRDVNNAYLASLTSTFPPFRLGPLGDVAKVNCTTCHQGAYKPLLGASMVSTYPELTTVTGSLTPATYKEPAQVPEGTPPSPDKPGRVAPE